MLTNFPSPSVQVQSQRVQDVADFGVGRNMCSLNVLLGVENTLDSHDRLLWLRASVTNHYRDQSTLEASEPQVNSLYPGRLFG
jgi:hypothetical protein